MKLPAVIEGPQVKEVALGGALEGADRITRETANWRPSFGSPDQIINRAKPVADARGRDLHNNDGPVHGAAATHKDSIVGAFYRLNAAPNLRVLNAGLGPGRRGTPFDQTWAEEFQLEAEAHFEATGESERKWLDAAGRKTVTDMIRQSVLGFMVRGEICGAAEWDKEDRSRPCKTNVQMISPTRLCNPLGKADDRFLSRGVAKNASGRPVGYHVRRSWPGEFADSRDFEWRYVPAYLKWGRPQFLHIYDEWEPEQTRGIADMVSALSHTRMAKQFTNLQLQNAVVQASYVAALESELPPDVVYGIMGAGGGAENFMAAVGAYLNMIGTYWDAAENVSVDGVKMPVLPPGTKINSKALAEPGGVGSDFQASLDRHTASALGLSYEDYANDFSKVSYSGGRLGVAKQERFMKARKKKAADGTANFVYGLWLEEAIQRRGLPMPRGVDAEYFYRPLMREAFSQCSWIGAGLGQIDELKETQAAILRVKAGFSTYEKECARFGEDFRKVFEQRAREEGLITKLSLSFSMDTQKSGAKDRQNTMSEGSSGGTKKKKASKTDE